MTDPVRRFGARHVHLDALERDASLVGVIVPESAAQGPASVASTQTLDRQRWFAVQSRSAAHWMRQTRSMAQTSGAGQSEL